MPEEAARNPTTQCHSACLVPTATSTVTRSRLRELRPLRQDAASSTRTAASILQTPQLTWFAEVPGHMRARRKKAACNDAYKPKLLAGSPTDHTPDPPPQLRRASALIRERAA